METWRYGGEKSADLVVGAFIGLICDYLGVGCGAGRSAPGENGAGSP